MKINILSKIVDIPSGGGNQFLKALQKYFIKKGIYEYNPFEADIILFNSFNFIEDGLFLELLKLRKIGKILVHRVDGPISLYRGRDIELDKLIYNINNQIADATIFQSKWSREANYQLGMEKKEYETIIMNAPDEKIFNREGKLNFSKNRKIKLIATSWSNNVNKGFDVYKWLDENLNFKKYEMIFVGNSPIKFNNIKHIKPLNSIELSKVLKESDIFITASKKDPCSNSLIEALHVGLPALVLNDGGHTEIVDGNGETFNSVDEIPKLLDKIIDNYEVYQASIKCDDLNKIANLYIAFFLNLKLPKNQSYNFKTFFILLEYYFWRVKRKFK